MEESPLFHLIKKIKDDWVSSKGIIYQDNIHHRIGDEIQCTALYKFLRSHNITINYKDSNPKISSLTLFPDNLVNYIKEIPYKKKIVDFLNLWSWSPLLASKGFYTEVQHKYNEKNIEFNYQKNGILHFYRNEKLLAKTLKHLDFQQSLGVIFDVLNKEEIGRAHV